MYLLRGSVAELSEQAQAGSMVGQLEKRFQEEFGRSAFESEVRSWKNSIPVLLRQLVEAGLDQAEVLLEFRLPGCSKRADALVLGEHPDGGPSCVVVENKQWSSIKEADIGHLLVTVPIPGMPARATEHVHPQEQVRDYAEYLIYYNCYLGQHPGSVAGCAYLHNASGKGISVMRHGVPEDLASFPAFAADESAAFRAFLTERLSPAPGARIADEVAGSRQAASMRLMQHVPDAIAGIPRFTLLDEQRIAFETVLRTVERAKHADSKEAVIIRGGPGTGKSAVAIQLLASRARMGAVAHATGSGAFTKTLREELGEQDRLLKKLFQFTSAFAGAPADSYDVIIVDEAQRVRMRDGQVDHLIRAARVPVFLIDERQWIRSDEIGTVDRLKQACDRNGVSVLEISLDGQFRCGGSDQYIKWLKPAQRGRRNAPMAGRRSLPAPARRLTTADGGGTAPPARRGIHRTDRRRILLEMDQEPSQRRFACQRRRHRFVAMAVERGNRRGRDPEKRAVGNPRRRLRPGRVRVHRPGIRV